MPQMRLFCCWCAPEGACGLSAMALSAPLRSPVLTARACVASRHARTCAQGGSNSGRGCSISRRAGVLMQVRVGDADAADTSTWRAAVRRCIVRPRLCSAALQCTAVDLAAVEECDAMDSPAFVAEVRCSSLFVALCMRNLGCSAVFRGCSPRRHLIASRMVAALVMWSMDALSGDRSVVNAAAESQTVSKCTSSASRKYCYLD